MDQPVHHNPMRHNNLPRHPLALAVSLTTNETHKKVILSSNANLIELKIKKKNVLLAHGQGRMRYVVQSSEIHNGKGNLNTAIIHCTHVHSTYIQVCARTYTIKNLILSITSASHTLLAIQTCRAISSQKNGHPTQVLALPC